MDDDDESKIQYLERMQEIKERMEKEMKDVTALREGYAKYLQSLESAKKRGNSSDVPQMLSIDRPWSSSDRQSFFLGMSKYTGKAKKVYCEFVGLTPRFLENAELRSLQVASVNLGLPMGKSQMMRTRLIQFLNS
eukprot:TRINITY_DN2504_c1_g1_i3.p2 TRINITY_DN2504_c1_g1~~TRINITY_DN2504_c1_g1_i3.p2  ORF type:complete len:135 (-),score=35.51 TRINITY_DN2504_c1_g1_i3:65-469(-)